ncbi:hypothetical protein CAOG_06877 [Capsaspora owczarzaki ATCC 30864]|uniref:Selenoprotein H n=1 Tax=Capsaspora owczarzaki (strain ATCC 30864) TaxID=595528 RepID=A0A0D2X4S6_CAPO3|nr:hypothetical protein CAOG_06877 [Capsaspora owczarzaki ATCC 30864]KJE96574.1 hypothetical protein CAOG_006877 [Capsaspora owczarzaki ATCC 30864]|eukprot:XP_004344498.1 hypothetical protein CAOG_06877 [Capsaspora owczarzaki ATCC 30864]
MPGAARRTRATARLDDDDDDDDIVAPSKSIAVKTEKKKDASVDDKKLVQSKIAFQANGAASTDSTATATAPAAGGASAIKQEASVHADKKPRLGLRFQFLTNAFPDAEILINPNKPRRGSFECTMQLGGAESLVWTGVKRGPPRNDKFPDGAKLVADIRQLIQ